MRDTIEPSAQRLTAADIAEMFSTSEEDIHIDQHGDAYYCGRRIASRDDTNPDFDAIEAWCHREKYWPNIWQANDHGNVELVTLKGESLGGLV